MCFAEEKSDRVLVTPGCAFPTTDLVIGDGLGHILDETVEQSGVILVPQESQQSGLFRERFQLFEDTREPPARGCISGSELWEWERTNLRRSSLRLYSE